MVSLWTVITTRYCHIQHFFWQERVPDCIRLLNTGFLLQTCDCIPLRERSLITGRGGQMKFYPYKKSGAKKVKGGGGAIRFEVVLTPELEVLAILHGGRGSAKSSRPFKGGGGGTNSFTLS